MIHDLEIVNIGFANSVLNLFRNKNITATHNTIFLDCIAKSGHL